jgi:hypothetical protein
MPITEAPEPVTTMLPPSPCSIIRGTAALMVCQTPTRLTSTTLRKPSSETRWAWVYSCPMPALASTTSTRPNSASPAARARSTWSWSRTSARVATISPPASRTRRTVSSRSAGPDMAKGTVSIWAHRSNPMTRAPSAASRSASARPWPRATPEMNATRPCRAGAPGGRAAGVGSLIARC